ncbi:hypothetical protein ACFQYP_57185 [Nonomuraea antimicrobica]
MGFEVGDAPILEPDVGSGRLKAFVECAVLGGELTDTLPEGGVLGGDPDDGLLSPFGFQIADLAEEFGDAGALGRDLGVGGLESVFSVQSPFSPGCFALGILVGK